MKSADPQVSVLCPLLFLICINDLSEYLASISKRFTNETSLIYVVKDCDLSAINLNNDLDKISNCTLVF